MKGCVARLFYSLFFLVPLPCHGKVLTYTRMVGQEKLLTTIQLEETAQGFTLTRQNAQEICKVVADPSGDTQRWEYANPGLKLKLSAVRQGSAIAIAGEIEGKPIQKQVQMEGAPWYQELGFSAKRFVLSSADSMTFFMIHPLKQSAHKMKLRKIGRTVVTVQGKTVESVELKVNMDSFLLSLAWSAHQWHRLLDGLFIKYRGDSLKLGAPDTIVEISSGL